MEDKTEEILKKQNKDKDTENMKINIRNIEDHFRKFKNRLKKKRKGVEGGEEILSKI